KARWEQQTKARNIMATPAIVRIKDKLQLIHFAGGVQGLDPATGKLLWSCKAPTSQSSPVIGGGMLYADAGRGGQKGVAIDPTGSGDVSKTNVKWEARIEGAAASSAIIVDGRIYRVSNNDMIKCLALDTGDLVYAEKAPRISPSASPIATPEGRIY